MFLCDDCQIRSICKIYDNIIQYRDIIALSECGARNLIDKQQDKSTPIFNEPEVDIEERIAAIQKLTPEIQKEIDYIKKDETNVCQDCKKENTDLLICSECQKQICPDCATEDFDGNVYCQECYDKKDGEML